MARQFKTFAQHFFKEAEYADGQDYSVPSSQPLADAAEPKLSKVELVKRVIKDLEDIASQHDWSKPIDSTILKAMADTLRDAGLEPTDFDAAQSAPVKKQIQYLFLGPSAWEGGKGALKDLKGLLLYWNRQKIQEDESVPGSDLAMGGDSGVSVGLPEGLEKAFRVGTLVFDDPYGTGRKHFNGTERIYAASEDDALRKHIDYTALKYNIRINPKILYSNAKKNGAKVTPLESHQTVAPQYWWNKD